MRGASTFALLLIVGCHAPTSSPAPKRCGPSVPSTAEHPLATRAGELAGDYELIQVRTQPVAGSVSTGRLHLMPLDSASRTAAVGGAVRDLIGWFDSAGADTLSPAGASSRDPARPGAALAGEHLRLGQPGNLEGRVEYLTITAVAAEGFWGWWKAEPGLELVSGNGSRPTPPDPAGYFCALRVRP